MATRELSPMAMLLGCVLFFSAQVFAASAVLGVDLGTEYIKAALVKPGIPLEIVLTKDSRRKEASAVAFKPLQNGPKANTYPERAYGSDAMALAARFPGDVYPNLKTLLGLPIDDSIVKEYAARHPSLQLEANKVQGTAAFKSKAFVDEEGAWTIEELLAMQLQSIQRNAEATAGAGTTIRSIVITVPPFFTIEEKRAIQLAVDLAGLKAISLISDGLAVGLNYATSRQFPNINEGAKPEYHMVFDMGAGSTKATVMKFQSRTVKDIGKFNKTIQEVQVVGAAWDRILGGDALNSLIVDDMVKQFVESKGGLKVSATAEGVKAHGRAIAKLSKEAERVRHILSANTNVGAGFEGLYEDADFKYKLTRDDFEKMAEAQAAGVGAVVREALKVAQLEITDLTSVILHGGASRTPFVQKELQQIVGSSDKIRTNVNSDEAAVFGAGFRAAELSPSFRVKEIRISEGSMYPSGMKWTNNKDKLQHQRLWTAMSPQGAVAKEVTFNNHADFAVTFYQQVGSEEKDTKVVAFKNLTATVGTLKEKYNCADGDIQFKVGVKLSGENGEVLITKATVECESEEPEKETFVDGVKNLFGFGKKDQKPLEGEDAETTESASSAGESETQTTGTSSATASTDTQTTASTSTESAEASGEAAKDAVKKKRLVVVPVEFATEQAGTPELSKDDLKKSKDRLKAFEASDKARRQREEALNQLEGYTYKVRDLLEKEAFIGASTAEEREILEKKAGEASEWLYGDGADASRDDLKKKHEELLDLVDPIQKRIDEAEQRPELVAGLKDALKQTTEFIGSIRKQMAEYDEWHSKSAASAAAASSTATSESSSTVTEAPSESSKGDFDGLEDDDTTTTTTTAKARTMEDVTEELGPVPPLYKPEDLQEVEDLYNEMTKWLKEAEEKQDALPPTADPVLLVKDLKAKRAKLDKAGVDLAMKGVNHFEKKKSNKKSNSKPKKAKGKKASATVNAGATAKTDGDAAEQTVNLKDDDGYIKFGGDGKVPTEAEIEEMIKKFQDEQAEKDKKKAKKADEHDEL